MWYVSFHGHKPGGSDGVNNVYAYRDDGTLLHEGVLPEPAGGEYTLAELRAIRFGPDGKLWVLSAYKHTCQLLRFSGNANAGGTLEFINVYASIDTAEAMVHPFDFTFDADGNCYVSSQDTNVVTRFQSAGSPLTGTVMPIAPYLEQQFPGNQLLPGTFVASSKGHLPGVPRARPDVPKHQGGLDVSFKHHKVHHSVRGVRFLSDSGSPSSDHLFVADEPGDRVRVYDLDGKRSDSLKGASNPVHLYLAWGILCIGSTGSDQVLMAFGPSFDAFQELINNISTPSGMAFGPYEDGFYFYVADREGRTIQKYDVNGEPPFGSSETFISDLPDDPEFLLYVPDAGDAQEPRLPAWARRA